MYNENIPVVGLCMQKLHSPWLRRLLNVSCTSAWVCTPSMDSIPTCWRLSLPLPVIVNSSQSLTTWILSLWCSPNNLTIMLIGIGSCRQRASMVKTWKMTVVSLFHAVSDNSDASRTHLTQTWFSWYKLVDSLDKSECLRVTRYDFFNSLVHL